MRASTRAVREATPGCKRALDVIWLALALFFVIAFPIDVSRSVADFPAFYCAGAAVNAHENPYLEVPLGPCEWSKSHDTIYLHRFIVPAPLPPYALALYAVAANFDYHVVYRLHIAFSLLALGAAAYCLSSLCRFPAVAIFALEILSAYETILNGQPVAFLLCAVVLCGWALHARRPRIAGALAAAMMFEPHLGLPLCAAVLLFSRRSRIVLATCATALLIVSLATLPLSQSILYLRDVLPAQAMSEAHFTPQFSLTLLLTTLGIETHPAIVLATLQYVVTAALGIVAAGRARPSIGNASIAFVPVAFALLGGTYIHFTQFLLALPAALLFTKYFKLQLTVSCVLLALTFDESGWNRSIDTSLVTAFAVFTWLAIAIVTCGLRRVRRSSPASCRFPKCSRRMSRSPPPGVVWRRTASCMPRRSRKRPGASYSAAYPPTRGTPSYRKSVPGSHSGRSAGWPWRRGPTSPGSGVVS